MDGADEQKKKRNMKASSLEKKGTAEKSSQGQERANKGETGPLAGDPTHTFPLDGKSGQQALVEMLATLLRQAGVGQ